MSNDWPSLQLEARIGREFRSREKRAAKESSGGKFGEKKANFTFSKAAISVAASQDSAPAYLTGFSTWVGSANWEPIVLYKTSNERGRIPGSLDDPCMVNVLPEFVTP